MILLIIDQLVSGLFDLNKELDRYLAKKLISKILIQKVKSEDFLSILISFAVLK